MELMGIEPTIYSTTTNEVAPVHFNSAFRIVSIFHVIRSLIIGPGGYDPPSSRYQHDVLPIELRSQN